MSDLRRVSENQLVLEGELTFLNKEVDSEVFGVYVGEKSLEDALESFCRASRDHYGEANAGQVRISIEKITDDHFVSRLIVFTYPSDSEAKRSEVGRVLNTVGAVADTKGVHYIIDHHDARRLMGFLGNLSVRLFGVDGKKETVGEDQ